MAILIHLATGKKISVRAAHTFGRNPSSAQTVLLAGDTSQIHASMRYSKERWELIDHSRNGSFINGKRLPINVWTELQVGQVLQFGHAPESSWKVVDLHAPATMLFPLDGMGQACLLNPLQNLLPNELQAEISIHIANTGLWVIENDDGITPLQDGAILEIGGQRWEFISSPQLQETQEIHRSQLLACQPTMQFHASLDEEHVSLSIELDSSTVDLGERTHHYALLILARQRQLDQQRGLDSASQGWLELSKLSQMLGLDVAHINIQIFRARNQLLQSLPTAQAWPDLIERRRGGVRFGNFSFIIRRGAQTEVSFNPH